jgi:hypothetical protein
MQPIPADLLAVLPEGAGPVADNWWATLSDADQRRLVGLWDERLEVKFFTPQLDDIGHVDDWEQVPKVARGRFVPAENDDRDEWSPEFFERLLQDPDLILAYEPLYRCFFIACTQHPAAQTCLALGQIPVEFTCPIASKSCPLLLLRGASLLKVARRNPGCLRNQYSH